MLGSRAPKSEGGHALLGPIRAREGCRKSAKAEAKVVRQRLAPQLTYSYFVLQHIAMKYKLKPLMRVDFQTPLMAVRSHIQAGDASD